jgi:hypothetical protein
MYKQTVYLRHEVEGVRTGSIANLMESPPSHTAPITISYFSVIDIDKSEVLSRKHISSRAKCERLRRLRVTTNILHPHSLLYWAFRGVKTILLRALSHIPYSTVEKSMLGRSLGHKSFRNASFEKKVIATGHISHGCSEEG